MKSRQGPYNIQLLKCLILLYCCYNEFIKFPKTLVFKNITLCARFTLRTLAGRLILRRHLKTSKAVFAIPNSVKIPAGWSATVLSALLALSHLLQTFACKDFDSEPVGSSPSPHLPIKKPPFQVVFLLVVLSSRLIWRKAYICQEDVGHLFCNICRARLSSACK